MAKKPRPSENEIKNLLEEYSRTSNKLVMLAETIMDKLDPDVKDVDVFRQLADFADGLKFQAHGSAMFAESVRLHVEELIEDGVRF